MLVWFKIYNCIDWKYSASKMPTIIWKMKSVMLRVFDWFPCRPALVWFSHILFELSRPWRFCLLFATLLDIGEGLMKSLWALVFLLIAVNPEYWSPDFFVTFLSRLKVFNMYIYVVVNFIGTYIFQMSLVSINSTWNLFFRLLNKLESVNCQQSSPQIVALAKNLSVCCLTVSLFAIF